MEILGDVLYAQLPHKLQYKVYEEEQTEGPAAVATPLMEF